MTEISPPSPPQMPAGDITSLRVVSRAARRAMRYPVAIAALMAAFVLGTGVTALMNHHAGAAQLPASSNPAPALTVASALPRQTIWPVTLEAWGPIAPWQEASIGTRIGGYSLVAVRVNVGDQVKKGDVLARLDPALLRADEAELQANYDQAEANRVRATALKSSGTISSKDALQYFTEAKTTKALLDAKQLQLRYTEIVAPDDGVISSRTATLGAVLSSGSELFRLIRQNRLEWHGELTASQLARIVPGQHVKLLLPDETTAEATVRETAPALDTASRLGTVYADLTPGSQARAGMYADGRVILSHTKALVVPADSIVIRDGYSIMFELSGDSATSPVTRKLVTVGRREGNEAEILSGIAPNARIVVTSPGFLDDGDIVRVTDVKG